MTPQDPTFSPFLERLWVQRRLFLAVLIAAIAVGELYTLLVPAKWEAKATLLFPAKDNAFGSMAAGSDAGALAAALGTQATPLKVYEGILASQHALDIVCAKTGLSHKDVKDMRDISDDKTENTITIAVDDRDKDLAKAVVADHLAALTQINRRISIPLFSDDVGLLKQEVNRQQAQVDRAERDLRKFEEGARTGPSVTAPPTSQSTSQGATSPGAPTGAIVTPASWLDKLRQLQVELKSVDSTLDSAQTETQRYVGGGSLSTDLPPVKRLRPKLSDAELRLREDLITLPPSSPKVKDDQSDVDAIKAQMAKEVGQYLKGVKEQALDPTTEPVTVIPKLVTQKVGLEAEIAAVSKLAAVAPAESVRLGHLLRAVQTEGGILQALEYRYKLAAIEAERNPNRWELLDAPYVEDRPTNKSYQKNGWISLVVGLFLASIAAVLIPVPHGKR